jgi:hypothetical protein
MEVNLSPSLGTDSSIDQHVKGNLIADTFNLICLKNFNRKKENAKKVRQRLRVRPGRDSFNTEIRRGEFFSAGINRIQEVYKETYEEYTRRGNFVRIFPSKGSDIYNKFFITQRALNKELYCLLFEENATVDISGAPPSS